MSLIPGVIASGISGHLGGNYTSIATQTVGSGGASSVTFSSIPSTYTHLQVRATVLNPTAGGIVYGIYNGDSGANYTRHRLLGNGSSPYTGGVTGQTSFNLYGDYAGTDASPNPTAVVMDILDYTSTSKLKTTRILSGCDRNGSGEVELLSSLYVQSSISAITSMTFTVGGADSSFSQYTQFALYGVK